MKKILLLFMLAPLISMAQTPDFDELTKTYLPFVKKTKTDIRYVFKIEYYGFAPVVSDIRHIKETSGIYIPELGIDLVEENPPKITVADSTVHFGNKLVYSNVKSFNLLRQIWYDENQNVIKDSIIETIAEKELKDLEFVNKTSQYLLEEIKKYVEE